MNQKENYYTCCCCECVKGIHIYFVPCKLFKDEYVCIECCSEMEKESLIQKVKEITQVARTREEVDKICIECNKRGI